MDEERPTIGRISPRRLALLVGLVVLSGLAILGRAFYRELGNLFAPQTYVQSQDIAETQDVRVQVGPLTKVLRLAGVVQAKREAKLVFQVAEGRILNIVVSPGQQVQAGETLVELDRAALERDLAKVRGELQEARRELETLTEKAGLTKRIKLQEELRQARASLDQAQRDLLAYKSGQDTPQARRTRAAVTLANFKSDLAALRTSKERQAQLEQLLVTSNEAEVKHGPYVLIQKPSEQDLDTELILRNDMLDKREALDQGRLQYEMDIRAAEQQVALAQRDLRNLERGIAAGSHTVENMRYEAAVKVAAARVQQILAQLAALDEAALDVDVAKGQAAVFKLEGQAADADAALAEANLVAPFAGVIDQIKVEAGTTISPGTEVVTMFSASDLRVVARVTDMDVAQLQAGQQAQLTFDAFPGQTFDGQLGDIPALGTYENGMTWFDVAVAFEAGEQSLWVGMGANVNVPLFRKEDVLIVPTMAVQSDEEGSFVILVQGRRTERRRVEAGISDGVNIEIVEGLEKGDVVRIPLLGPIGPK